MGWLCLVLGFGALTFGLGFACSNWLMAEERQRLLTAYQQRMADLDALERDLEAGDEDA